MEFHIELEDNLTYTLYYGESYGTEVLNRIKNVVGGEICSREVLGVRGTTFIHSIKIKGLRTIDEVRQIIQKIKQIEEQYYREFEEKREELKKLREEIKRGL